MVEHTRTLRKSRLIGYRGLNYKASEAIIRHIYDEATLQLRRTSTIIKINHIIRDTVKQ
jgi:hypothetical protein